MDRSTRIGVPLFFVIGIGLLVASMLTLRARNNATQYRASHTHWQAVEGTLESCSQTRSQDGAPYYSAEVRWSGPDGRRYGTHVGSVNRIVCGDTRRLRYNPADPSTSESEDPPPLDIMLPMILGLIGGAFFLFALRVMSDAVSKKLRESKPK